MLFSFLATSLAGILSWSFTEFALHYWVGHKAKGKNAFSKEHLQHHAEKDYFAPPLKKWLLALPSLAFAGILSYSLLGSVYGALYTLSFGMAWLSYESLHYRLHTVAPRGPLSRFLRLHHFYHHFQNPWKNHGVTSPIWDFAFGTWQPVQGPVQVPASHAMDWLLDQQGKVHSAYCQDYQLRESKRQNAETGTV
ncbi:hypothetical protein COW36_09760 [bacterium (Candidatus Blackallbacteria) CG17_big_fil_post_rev_8_21_14_2_50_48_46]|uniref:Fatty acid hydroxylase domain-containing protein n=1 Tax=bacterium (Candidatus Blackallbacteria) CG17_big_fil_post_rev_8_21_14_2_50_48_46 TaxID=2014261 RepID=A0A2M7G5K8_9BACT|nr:MAG: hypothetical protein COW64_01650 [bacterium (Candidatus Blackallbacteria) CG18_big_fil_WC_8_21_14_2_50_49_26]PIW17245.1 MAG: hypothetical protein COW36_09760 [bacterium (Candidatus Blackallbacteria) CG17_big_fil_post_rev_8_21_14_2_50_48_46]PIW51037.1 MAG: hypothetical protein COW20_00770 [bacterium (Candidatus Blackallbacteria) CG13_big_fil_rev_8_21_14_2_50_49_14]